jgi:hypothetical protein
MSTRRTEHNKNEVKDPSNDPDGDTRLNFGEDDENMVSSSEGMAGQGYIFEASSIMRNREKHLRYRTRVFAAEYMMPFFTSFFFFFWSLHLNSFYTPHTQTSMHILVSLQCTFSFSLNEMKCLHLDMGVSCILSIFICLIDKDS